MTVELIVRRLVILSVLTAISGGQPVVALEAKSDARTNEAEAGRSRATTPQSKPTSSPKGVAHIGCVFAIYTTLKEAIDFCYPGQYSDLDKHLMKWIPLMLDYVDRNAIKEQDKRDYHAAILGMKNPQKYLDSKSCEQTKPFIDRMSKANLGNALDEGMKELFKKADEPGRLYGCL